MEGLVVAQRDICERINKAKSNFKKSPKDRLTKEYVDVKLESFEKLWDQFVENHSQLLRTYGAKILESDYMKKDMYSETEDNYVECKLLMKMALAKYVEEPEQFSECNLNPSKSNTKGSNAKLPKIVIPKFSGKYSEWSAFRDLYVSLVHNTEMEPIQKMQYLKGLLSGEAEQLVRHISLAADNYTRCWDMLETRYNNKRYLCNTVLKRLLEQPNAKAESARFIRELLDTTSECLGALSSLRVNVSSWDIIIVYIASLRLDHESRKQWELQSANTTELPTWKSFEEFLTNRFRALEFVDSNPIKAKSHHPPTQRSFHVTEKSDNTITCKFCKDSHRLAHCKKFQSEAVQARRQFVEKSNLCFNCLGDNHRAIQCRSLSTCRVCQRRHHTYLHIKSADSGTEQKKENSEAGKGDSNPAETVTPVVCFSSGGMAPNSEVLLATALVRANTSSGDTRIIRALLDQGSQASFVTEATAQYLGLKRTTVRGVISGVGGSTSVSSNSMVNLTIKSIYDHNVSLNLNVYVLKSITTLLPSKEVVAAEWILGDIPLADPKYNIPNKIDILLGAAVYGQVVQDGVKKNAEGTLLAQNTTLGWILSGIGSNQDKEKANIISMHTCLQNVQLKRFWELEADSIANKKTMLTEEEARCEELFAETTARDQDGRYIVRLPFKTSNPVLKLEDSKRIAERRLNLLVAKLSKSSEMKAKNYTDVMEEYLKLGHMEKIPEGEVKKSYGAYLSHFAVIRNDKDTTKVRIVFDASCKGESGVSLNDLLMVGPRLQPELRHLLIRWRSHRICLSADIVKMYRQVKVAAEDVDFQRILWKKDQLTTKTEELRLLRVTFGTASAPYLAVKALQQVAHDEGANYPSAAEKVRSDFYMDDLLTGCEDLETAMKIYSEMNELLLKGGFELQKWSSNCDKVLEIIKKAGEGMDEEEGLKLKEDEIMKLLGLTWNRKNDAFQYTVTLPPLEEPVTKRKIISDIARLFDPIGWVAPCVIVAKAIIQKLWISGTDWDEIAPNKILEEWISYRDDLVHLSSVKIPRWIQTSQKNLNVELHGFSDASKMAYAAAVYVRVVDENGDIHVNLVTAKTKVAPIKQISIPRLELCGAVLVTRLLLEVSEVLKINKELIHAWTDSTVVLAWLNSHPSRWQTFVANRVSEILTSLEAHQWSHIRSQQNPADGASRGLKPKELIENNLWFKGPQILHEREVIYNRLKNEETNIEEIKAHIATKQEGFWDRFSNLNRMIRVIAYCRRFISWKQRKGRGDLGILTTTELKEALETCIRECQREHFGAEIAMLENNTKERSTKLKNPLKSLNPYIDAKNILRVGGRLEHTSFTEDRKHPILIPKRSVLTDLIVADAHAKTLHGGIQLMLTYLRSKFWILGAKNLVKRYVRTCVKCVRYSGATATQMMGQLPVARVTPTRPFRCSGVDYAGPINVRTSKGRGHHSYKGYICLFVCMATKAVHLEVVSDLTTQGFLAAFRRFVSRRGHCSDIWSDNGTNFVGASRELADLFSAEKATMSTEIAQILASEGTQWHFIPPLSPNFGGLWEAGVKSVKFHLKRVIGETTLTYEELSTVLGQIEACLNSRPLFRADTESEGFEALTPGHFLASRKISKCGYLFVAPGWDFSNPLYRTKRWQRRWFVLYDDGELTYSLDEHPDTVPQASVDMTTVLEVSEADSVTGHQHSLAITAPERVTFVKGTCREEARWWADVLSVYPRSKGRHKRNATFPGGQTASLLQSSTTTRKYSADASTLREVAECGPARQRYSDGTITWPGPRVQPPQAEIPSLAAPTPIDTKVYTDQPVSSASPPTRDKINGDEKARSRRRDTWAEPTTNQGTDEAGVGVRSPLLQQQHQQYDEQLRDIAASLTRPRSRRALPPPLERPTRLPPPDRLPARGSPDGGAPPEEGVSSSASEGSETTDAVETTESAEPGRVELPAERLLHARAGWLQRRGGGGVWSRHWFVLRGAALLYFRDPHAEHRGLMDGVIDLSGISRVVDLPAANSTNGYAFETETWDGKHIVLSAVTAGIRANWVSAMRRTAGLPDTGPLSLILREDNVDRASESSTSPITPVTPLTGKSAPFSSDEEYRTASEGGRRDSADWGEMGSQPPASPILARTPISKVKEKVRARGCYRSPPLSDTTTFETDEIDATKEKEDRPPEVDENEKPNEPRKRSYISTIDKQTIQIEDLRKQLKMALNDVSAAENELTRLHKVKSDAAVKEKKMEDLVIELQKKEEELVLRTKEAENLDAIKQLYNQDKSMWETKLTETQNFLKESTEHCELLTRQLTSAQETIAQLQRELNELNDRLLKSVKENDNLYAKIRDLEGRVVNESPTREKRKSVGSLSDLTNLNTDLNLESLDKNRLIEEYDELRGRFLKAIQEIKAMKKELRDSHSIYDELEVINLKLRNEMKLREQCSRSEIDLMAARILDLTQKLTASDKQVRTLKHKIQKTESREKRRSLSLKGRESLTLGKEVEEKLSELEQKITMLESGEPVPIINSPSKSASPAKESKKLESTEEKRMKRLAARLRRKSLDSATSSEPMKMLVRLSSLETKVASALEIRKELTNSCESLGQATRSTESPALNDSPDSSATTSTASQAPRHLLERLHSLESAVIHSRNKVNECLCQMSNMRAAKTRRSPSPSLERKYSVKSMERCLVDVSRRLQECVERCESAPAPGLEPDPSVVRAVAQLEDQLRAKLTDISRRKAALYEAGELTPRRALELLAEKLAYEAVLVGRIRDALETAGGDGFFARLIRSEITETGHLIEDLRRRLGGEHRGDAATRHSLEYLARVLSRRVEADDAPREPRRAALLAHRAELDELREAQRELDAAVDAFKAEKLGELAAALAGAGGAPGGDADAEAAGEAARVRSAWAAARDALGAELVQAEVARALARAARACEGRLDDARRAHLTLAAQERADLELWWRAAHDHLRCEMDAAARDVAQLYRRAAAAAPPSPPAAPPAAPRALLQQLGEALALRALVTARVAVLAGTCGAAGAAGAATDGPRREDAVSSLTADPAQEAEFVFLFQRFSTECRALFSSDCSGDSEDSMKIGESLERAEAAVEELRRRLGADGGGGGGDDAGGETAPAGLAERAEALRRRVEALHELAPCQHCKQLQDALDRLKEERSRGEHALAQQAAALAAARRARAQLGATHERERTALRERARTLQRRLAALDSEYSAQLDSLRAAYQSAVAADTHGDGLRARYQQEIEQLRALCEKGLLAMESSHRRIVREMEDKHRAEREQLRLDKEQALAEETRATLAALDAMRKAHESEVRREVDKFKAEFLARGAKHDLGQLSSRHQQEMEEIKREILSLSEKYSVKCVESAALEERLATCTAQLAQAHNHIMQLDSRNKQLRAHLISEANEMKNSEGSSLSQLIEETAPAKQRSSPLLEAARPSRAKIQFAKTETTRNLQLSPVQN